MVINPKAYVPSKSDLEALFEYGILLTTIAYVPQFWKEARIIVEIIIILTSFFMSIRYFKIHQYFHSLLFTIIGALSALVFFIT